MARPHTLPAVTAPTVDEHGVLLLAPEFETVSEHSRHAQEVNRVVTGLRARYAGRDDVAVHDRLAWFPDRDDTSIRLDPDVMDVFGRPKTGAQGIGRGTKRTSP